MAKLPVFSIILTTYNGVETIESVVQSILAQEGKEKDFALEIIAIDDASTDHTVQILEQFPIKIWINERNTGGPNAGRNRGLEMANGDFFCIADQDDSWFPNRLQEILPVIQRFPIVSSGYSVYDVDKNQQRNQLLPNEEKIITFDHNQTFLEKLRRTWSGQNTYLGALFFDKSLQNLRFEEQYGQVDYNWILQLFHQQQSAEVNLPLYQRKLHGANLSMKENYRLHDFEISRQAIAQYANQYPQQVSQGLKRLHGSLARYYYLVGKMPQARHHFRQADGGLKIALFYLTSYFGHQFIRKKVHFYG